MIRWVDRAHAEGLKASADRLRALLADGQLARDVRRHEDAAPEHADRAGCGGEQRGLVRGVRVRRAVERECCTLKPDDRLIVVVFGGRHDELRAAIGKDIHENRSSRMNFAPSRL